MVVKVVKREREEEEEEEEEKEGGERGGRRLPFLSTLHDFELSRALEIMGKRGRG